MLQGRITILRRLPTTVSEILKGHHDIFQCYCMLFVRTLESHCRILINFLIVPPTSLLYYFLFLYFISRNLVSATVSEAFQQFAIPLQFPNPVIVLLRFNLFQIFLRQKPFTGFVLKGTAKWRHFALFFLSTIKHVDETRKQKNKPDVGS